MAKGKKLLILGVDGMDPVQTKYYLDQGQLPNIKAFVDRGAQREDLVLLGNVPTITPPMWTTLATGAYPSTHGITCFWNQDHEHLDTMVYALDSRMCKAEQLWNIFALEEGKKTLVWHWPGSSWPPTVESDNLHVVDGAQPGAVNEGCAGIESEKMTIASTEIKELAFKPKTVVSSGAGCIIEDLPEEEVSFGSASVASDAKHVTNIMLTHEDGELALDRLTFDLVNSPIKPAKGWANAPEGALEFTLLTSNGTERRPGLILRNAQGEYDRVALYESKKAAEPFVALAKNELKCNVVERVKKGETEYLCSRHYRLLDIKPDGSYIRFWASAAYDTNNDSFWYPKTLMAQVKEHVGPVPPTTITSSRHIDLVEQIMLPVWDNYCQWQADALNYLIDTNGYEVVFSHIHNIDTMGHGYFHFCTEHEGEDNSNVGRYHEAMAYTYRQTDAYLGRFLHYLQDEGWTVFIVSDHGLLVSENMCPLLGDPFGVNVGVMEELGYTVTVKDEQGRPTKAIDWSKTRAVANRGNQIFLNIKGRYATGIVEPADQYDLERQIIDDLYGYRLNGRRIVSLALRNQDAALLGMSGPECGDIMYWLEEGYNRVHGDSLSTFRGQARSSVSPIFIACGPGVKSGVRLTRHVRQVDFAPTVAAVMGVRVPKQCDGGIVTQILDED